MHHIQSSVKGMVMCPGPVSRGTALSTVTRDVNCKYGAFPFLSDFRIVLWFLFPTIHYYSQCPECLRQNGRPQTCTNEQMLSWTRDMFVELTYGADSIITTSKQAGSSVNTLVLRFSVCHIDYGGLSWGHATALASSVL